MGFRGSGSGGGGVTFASPSAQIDIADTINDGVSGSAARADHQHAFPAGGGVAAVLAAASTQGVSQRPARMDHTHAHTAADHRAGGHADLTGDFDPAGEADAVFAAGIAVHEGAANPHPVYLTQAEGDGRYPLDAEAVLQTLADAKGDLPVATAADTWGRLAKGTDGFVLLADSSAPTGLKWDAVPAPGAADHGTLTGLADDDHPTYLKSETGTYTGDGTTDRTIPLGFDPVFVYVTQRGSAIGGITPPSTAASRGLSIGSSAVAVNAGADVNSERPNLGTGGFVVSGGAGSTNQSSVVFDFIAFGKG